MNKYFLVGDYVHKEVETTNKEDYIEVAIPFRGDDNVLQYGIGHALKKLKENGVYPTEDGIDILTLAGLVYLADTRISRNLHSQDSWTREIAIEIPVYNLEKWTLLGGLFTRMLNFLTGDRWTISFRKRDEELSEKPEDETPPPEFDAVTLFSGGMDSLIGTINHLENHHKTALISHAGDAHTKNAQSKLLAHLQGKYPDLDPLYLDLWMVFEKNLLPGGGNENTTRSRSFLFIAFGIFAMSGMKGVSTLEVPENGLIALNVPLEELRIGSHSTRTTHPFYLDSWNQVLNGLGIDLSVRNPYWYMTKGEMADECLNKDFLLQVIQDSISCSSPQKARWSGAAPQHCGYCVPCIIRRAAMNKAFKEEKDSTLYLVDSVSEIAANHAKGKGVQLRSFKIAINKIKRQPQLAKILIHKSGPLSGEGDYLQKLSDVYQRGLLEVDDFIIKSSQSES
ncbi:7-cyano-7-deazaguanine synthase [Pelotomaculum sp. FP]|uniref:Qat anti-phage system QueC-like protein QatC n=1 Tax=Pelotomaculum sp. FP TaxID=261474 RepID=UPI001065A06C|nr:Qat anti-phage system QueC-like protein QatC [Pelotomaculum sp. FP]TEB12299.1 7-cyano-7-deazaguanine synthase [Pelotomaculum sp. FP]